MSLACAIEADLIALCPDLRAALDRERDLYASEEGSLSVHAVFTVLSRHVADRLAHGPAPELGVVFDYVESKLTEDDSEVDNAATTCFLENLMNRVPETIAPQHLVPRLGPRSRRFCRAWDEWCGVKTEGLW